MSRWKKFFLAVGIIASIFIVRATGLDQGLIDNAIAAFVEAITPSDEVAEEQKDQEKVEVIVPVPEPVPE